MKKPDLEGLSQEQLKYVEYLEGCLNGSSELILALNTASRVFASDLNLICGEDDVDWVADGDKDVPKTKRILLSDDSKDKTFDRIMVLFDKFDKIKALSNHFKGVTKQEQETSKVKLKPGGNIYEHFLDEAKNGRASRI